MLNFQEIRGFLKSARNAVNLSEDGKNEMRAQKDTGLKDYEDVLRAVDEEIENTKDNLAIKELRPIELGLNDLSWFDDVKNKIQLHLKGEYKVDIELIKVPKFAGAVPIGWEYKANPLIDKA